MNTILSELETIARKELSDEELRVVEKVHLCVAQELSKVVPKNPEDGIKTTTDILVNILKEMVTSDELAHYGMEKNRHPSGGIIRDIDPDKDVYWFTEEEDPRMYYVQYFFNLVASRTSTGLIQIDSRWWNKKTT